MKTYQDLVFKSSEAPYQELPSVESSHSPHDVVPVATVEEKTHRFLFVFPVYLIAFLRAFRASEPFLTQFLAQNKGFSLTQINNEIYAIPIYTQLGFLIIISIGARAIGYKNAILLRCLCLVATYGILIWTSSLLGMQLMQVTYGIDLAFEGVFDSYIYSLVSKELYDKMTGTMRATNLSSSCLAYILGQVLVSYVHWPFERLFYMTFASSCMALLVGFFLPSVTPPVLNVVLKDCSTFKSYFKDIGKIFKKFIHSPQLVWWGLASILVGVSQSNFSNYTGSLWYDMDNTTIFNGYVQSGSKFVGAICALIRGRLKAYINRRRVPIIFLLGCMTTLCCFFSLSFYNLWLAYGLYIVYNAGIQAMTDFIKARFSRLTRDSDEAEHTNDSKPLLFGFCQFSSLLIQSLMNIMFHSAFNLQIKTRYMVYIIFSGIVAVFLMSGFCLPKIQSIKRP